MSPAIVRHSGTRGGWLVAAAALLIVSPVGRAAADPAGVSVHVHEDHGVYTVAAKFVVDEPPAVALAVLTDYEQIPRFMPDVRTSIVRGEDDGRRIVEQEAVSSVMMFSKRVHLVLEIQEAPDRLVFRDRCHTSFRRYEGAWTLLPENGQTAITYELTAEPSFDVPGFMLKRLLKRDSAEMIARLAREIAARAATASGATLPPR